MKSHLFTLAIALGAALSAPHAGASVVLSYDIAAAVNPSSVAVGSVAAGATASSITRGDGISASGYYNGTQGFFGGIGYAEGATRIADDYLQFSITAMAGQQITYSELTYGLFREIRDASPSLTGPAFWDLVYSLDGFATAGTNIATVTVPNAGVDNTLNQASFHTDISAIGTQSGSVTFRLYGYGSLRGVLADFYAGGLGNGSGGGIGRDGDRAWTGTGSNVFLNGTVSAVSAVPEPSTILCALTALTLAGGLRRQQRGPKAQRSR